MAQIQLPPFVATQELDEQTLGELEVWLTDMAELVNTQTLVDNTQVISIERLQTIVAASTSFADFQTRIAAL